MSRPARIRRAPLVLRSYVLVDMAYRPKPCIVDACANREALLQEAEERNRGGNRFRVYTALTKVRRRSPSEGEK